jgi:hypothetical protein
MNDAFIIKYHKILNNFICQDIIDEYSIIENTEKRFKIPKNNVKWENIERLLYKELLIHINIYKNKLLILSSSIENTEMIQSLNTTLFLKDFVIQCVSVNNDFVFSLSYNRYNVLNFIFCLSNKTTTFEIAGIKQSCKQGDMVLFPNNIKYTCKYNDLLTNENIYFISGQLCNDNVM